MTGKRDARDGHLLSQMGKCRRGRKEDWLDCEGNTGQAE